MQTITETFPQHVHELNVHDMTPGTVQEVWLHLINNGIGEPVRIPIMIARGKHPGPVMGITAAIHGNELNGIPVIQRLFQEIDVNELAGTVVGVLVVNIPGLLMDQRKFNDDVDLNRIAPGKPNGDLSQVYIHRVINRILSKFEYLIDLHTASFGRINSWYIRSNMARDITAKLARLQNPDIILNNPPNDGTFRGAASHLGIPAITLELKDPNVFQENVIEDALIGIKNALYYLKMMKGEIVCPVKNTILCSSSYWLYTDEGGILEVFPKIKSMVSKGDRIATVKTIFGKVIREYFAPEDGIVIGKSVSPINQTGSRILHLGLNPVEIPCIVDEL